MISSRKCQLVITFILFCICVPVLGVEANEPKTELKFEISSEKQDTYGIAKVPIKPTHVAVLLIKIESERIPVIDWNVISNGRVGQTMSQEQHDFLNQGEVSYYRPVERAYYEFGWYAVSEDDARKMPQAFIEDWTNKAKSKLKDLLDEQQGLEEKIAKVEKRYEEKITELHTTWDELREKSKGCPHSIKDYNDPVRGLKEADEAKETIEEMYKKLDELNIEIEGIKAKLLAIEVYKAKKNVGTNILAKLEQIQCEQNIELAGASARKKAVLEIIMREEEFYNLYKKSEKAGYEADKLKGAVYYDYERTLRRVKEKIANPTPDMLPPKVYRNKVTIYPVLAEE